MISRRALLGGLAAGALGSACGNAGGDAGVIRIGYLPNVSHAPLVVGLASGRIQRAVAPLRIETRLFRAGPRVVEAMLGRSIDIGTTGPAPVVITQARHGEATLRILSGLASGGASFVVTKASGIVKPHDLRGKTLASVQLGSTQDVALRKFVRSAGFDSTERGGDVRITALSGAAILLQMQRGAIDGAWLPEPWATRVVREIEATRLIDERDLWTDRTFASAIVVSRQDFLAARRDDVTRTIEAIGAEIDRALLHPEETRDAAYAAIKAITGNPGTRPVFAEAWKFLDYSRDPLNRAIAAFANDAFTLGLVPRAASKGLFS